MSSSVHQVSTSNGIGTLLLLIKILSNYHYIVQQVHLSYLMTKYFLILLACIHLAATLCSACAPKLWIVVKCINCATVRSSRTTLLLNTHGIICCHLKVTGWTKTEECLSTSSSSVELSLLTCTSYWNKLSRSFSLSPSTLYAWVLWWR